MEAAARAGADGAAKVTNPAASAASAENEGLVSPVPPAAGASGGPEGPLPGGGMFDRPHHRAAFCLEESLPTQEDDEAGERVWRGGAVLCVASGTRASCEAREGATVGADGDATVETPPLDRHFLFHEPSRPRTSLVEAMRFCQRVQSVLSSATAGLSRCDLLRKCLRQVRSEWPVSKQLRHLPRKFCSALYLS